MIDRRGAARSGPVLGLAALLGGWLPSDAASVAPPASPVATIAAPSRALAPLAGDDAMVPLVVSPFRDAMVSVPVGATEPRPVVVALHGNYDRPEWQCEVWRAVTRAFPFVLCPRGIPRPDAPPPLDRWTYGKSADVRREVEAGLSALGQRFGEHVAPGPILYAGFSLGAIVGVGIVSDQAARFPRAVLIEGGHSQWTRERAQAFASAGGRVLFACGQPSCKSEVTAPKTLLSRAGAAVHVVYGDERAHTYDGKVADAISPELGWLTEGDPRWAPLAKP